MPTLDEVNAQIAALGLVFRWPTAGAVKELPGILGDDETIEQITAGSAAGRNGVLVVTNRRAVFVGKGAFGSRYAEDFPLEKITSIQYATGALAGAITIHASGNRIDIVGVPKALTQPIGEGLRMRVAARGADKAVGAAAGDDPLDQLRKLSGLHADGIISDEEYAAKKKQLLGL